MKWLKEQEYQLHSASIFGNSLCCFIKCPTLIKHEYRSIYHVRAEDMAFLEILIKDPLKMPRIPSSLKITLTVFHNEVAILLWVPICYDTYCFGNTLKLMSRFDDIEGMGHCGGKGTRNNACTKRLEWDRNRHHLYVFERNICVLYCLKKNELGVWCSDRPSNRGQRPAHHAEQ